MTPYRLFTTTAAICSCLLALPAEASLITVSGMASDGIETNVYGPLSDSNFVSGNVSAGLPSAPSDTNYPYGGGAESWGNEFGAYGASAYGVNNFDVTAQFRRLISITNDSAAISSYSLDFLIYGGFMSAGFRNYTGYDGYASTSYSLTISRGMTTLFSSLASLDSNGIL